MTQKHEQIFEDLSKSTDFLQSVYTQPRNAYMIAAAIQAFEITFELAWKYMQAYLAVVEGKIANSPKSSIREYSTVKDGVDAEQWLEFADLRNLTSHTYRTKLADEMYDEIQIRFIPLTMLTFNL
jgi:nucleotidyltransferase substrate binding protein (TIGR01987 family)